MSLHNKNLERVLSYLLSEQTPEASKDEVFGQFLFAEPGANVRKDKAQEPNTPEENEFLAALRDLYDHNEKESIAKIIQTNLWRLKHSGQYKKYIVPPKKTIYRGMNLDFSTTSTILGLDSKELSAIQKGGPPRKFIISGDLDPQSSGVMSWSTDIKVAMHTCNLKTPDRLSPDKFGIMFAAKSAAPNDFYLNPHGILTKLDHKKISPAGYLADEFEVISFGPVKFDYIVIVRGNREENDIWF